jgi:hypothetical protein
MGKNDNGQMQLIGIVIVLIGICMIIYGISIASNGEVGSGLMWIGGGILLGFGLGGAATTFNYYSIVISGPPGVVLVIIGALMKAGGI